MYEWQLHLSNPKVEFSHRQPRELTWMRENRFNALILSHNDENQPWKTNNSYWSHKEQQKTITIYRNKPDWMRMSFPFLLVFLTYA